MRLIAPEQLPAFLAAKPAAALHADADWPAIGVSLVVYYQNGALIAALVSAGQNVRVRVERVLNGEAIGPNDGTAGA